MGEKNKKNKAMTDMTVGSPFRLLLAFAIPIFIGNVCQQIYNLVDTAIVGKFVGANELAAVGVTGNISFFFNSLIIGLTGGIAIVMSQFFGAGDLKTVKRSFGTSIYAIVLAIILVTVFGLLLVNPLLKALDTPDNIIQDAKDYLNIIVIGMFATVTYNWMSSVLRALGDSVTPLIFLVLSSIVNIGLDLLFIIKFHWGVSGAAWATVIAQALSALLCLIYGIWKMPVLRVHKDELKLNMHLLVTMIRVGLPAGIQMSLISVSIMLMQKAINAYGSTVVAGFIGASKIEQIAMQFGNSIGMANGTYTGQNVGAGNYERVEKGIRISAIMIAGGCLIISPLIFFFGDSFMKMFVDMNQDAAAQVVSYGTEYLKIMTFALVAVGILQVFQNMLRSAGDVAITMIMGGSEVLTRVIVAFAFSALFGRIGVWFATPITWITAMSVGWFRYLSGKWKVKGLVGK